MDYLIDSTKYKKEQILMITIPLKTKEQATKFLNWVKQQKPNMYWCEMRKQALKISKEE